MKYKHSSVVIVMSVLLPFCALHAHFQTLIPSTTICDDPEHATITLDLTFCHPFEGDMMHMAKPVQFGVVVRGDQHIDLFGSLKGYDKKGYSAWQTKYTLDRPGDHVFFVEPAPYWEPAEGCFIIHYTKVVVNGFGMEVGWDAEVGLKTEIIPLTRPYGLYTGNVFQGLVLVNGEPAPFCEVEVEYLNEAGLYSAPADPFITQVIKTNASGVFTYAVPAAGWWGFAALNEDDRTMCNLKDGKEYPIEIGALIWVYFNDME